MLTTVLPFQVIPIEDVFQLASLSQYDLYCMARGAYAGLKVAAVQTNDDAKEEESQTDEVCAPWPTRSSSLPGPASPTPKIYRPV